VPFCVFLTFLVIYYQLTRFIWELKNVKINFWCSLIFFIFFLVISKKGETMSEFKTTTQKESILGVKGVWKDIVALPKWFKWLLIVGSAVIIFFNFFDVQGAQHGTYFLPQAQYDRVIRGEGYSTFGYTKGAAWAVAILYSFNGLAAFTGLLAVAMIVKGRPSQYFWGFRNNKISDKKSIRAFFWAGTLAAIAFSILMWLFYIPEASNWFFGRKEYSIPRWETITIDGKKMPGEIWGAAHILDGLNCGTEFIACIFQALNLDQQFYIWFSINFLKVLKFSNIAPDTLSINMLLQFAVFFVFSFIGLWERNLQPLFTRWGWIKPKSKTPTEN